jgi:hypothetical protein
MVEVQFYLFNNADVELVFENFPNWVPLKACLQVVMWLSENTSAFGGGYDEVYNPAFNIFSFAGRLIRVSFTLAGDQQRQHGAQPVIGYPVQVCKWYQRHHTPAQPLPDHFPSRSANGSRQSRAARSLHRTHAARCSSLIVPPAAFSALSGLSDLSALSRLPVARRAAQPPLCAGLETSLSAGPGWVVFHHCLTPPGARLLLVA